MTKVVYRRPITKEICEGCGKEFYTKCKSVACSPNCYALIEKRDSKEVLAPKSSIIGSKTKSSPDKA